MLDPSRSFAFVVATKMSLNSYRDLFALDFWLEVGLVLVLGKTRFSYKEGGADLFFDSNLCALFVVLDANSSKS